VSSGRRLACVAVAAVVLLSMAAPEAWASDYVIASDAESITVDQAIHPGQTVTLPSFGIYNKGTKRADYEMVVVAVDKAGGLDATWVEFSPRTFSLDPGGVSKISATVVVPSDTRPGTYRALLAGRVVNPGGSDVQMSVGIGPMLTMEVAGGWWLSAAWFKFTDLFQRSAPWSYFGAIVAALAILAVVLALISRRSARLSRDGRSSAGDMGRRTTGSRDLDESAQGDA
jgi:hypothetical protein